MPQPTPDDATLEGDLLPALAPGTRIDRYVVEGSLGEGGMGAVYAARRDDLPLRVALKVMRPTHDSPEGRRRFAREAETLARLRHPHIVEVFDRGEWQGAPYLVMPLLEGETLGRRFERAGALALPALLDALLPCIAAVATAHDAGVVHRDLKPDNLFLERSPDGVERPRVLDFGVARVAEPTPTAITGTGAVVGTPRYMAPEQLWGARTADGRSDQWAFGVMLFEGSTGRHPFPVEGIPELVLALHARRTLHVRDVVPSLPDRFDAVLARALAHEPGARFPDLRALGAALLPFAGEVARATWGPVFERAQPEAALTSSRSAARAERPPSVDAVSLPRAPSRASRPWGTSWGIVAAVGFAAVGGVALWRWSVDPPRAPTLDAGDAPSVRNVVPDATRPDAALDAARPDAADAADTAAPEVHARPPRAPATPRRPTRPPVETSDAPRPPPTQTGANGAPIRY